MNAYHLMAFLLLFNISMSVVLSMSIYTVPVEPVPIVDVDDTNTSADFSNPNSLQKANLLYIFGGNVIAGLLMGVVFGGALAIWTQIPGDAAFAYSIFITFYWTMAKNTVDILYAISEGTGAGDGLIYVVAVFVAVLAVSFVSFMIQLVRGPWGSMR